MLTVAAVVLTADRATKAAVLAIGPGASVSGGLLRVAPTRNRCPAPPGNRPGPDRTGGRDGDDDGEHAHRDHRYRC
jgi:hypothetical protein